MQLHVRIRSLKGVKGGNAAEEYEDACCPAHPVMRRGPVIRAAVADGATESSFSGLWARMLSQAFTSGRLHETLPRADLGRLESAWRDAVGVRPLPWYAEEKARQGAFSSLVGLTMAGDTHVPSWRGATSRCAAWRALAVGDSCLFQVREDDLVTAFPIRHSSAFGSAPHLIGSNPVHNQRLEGHVHWTCGGWRPGDLVFLMTDALAAWFLSCWESGGRPWDVLCSTRSADFEALLGDLRTARAIRNDDSTALIMEML